jgi:hypothetical protein
MRAVHRPEEKPGNQTQSAKMPDKFKSLLYTIPVGGIQSGGGTNHGPSTGFATQIGVRAMAEYEKGTLLTCGHEGCGCRVRIEVECHCADAGQPYRCTCGDELVAVPAAKEPA